MNNKLYEALDVCIQALETGAGLEDVLKRYPQLADELRPLLEAIAHAESLSIPSAPDDVIKRARARVLQHAAEMRETSTKPRRIRFSFARLAVSLALALIFILSGTGLVRAASGALPGDNLYPVKRTWEDVRLLLILDAEVREELEYEFETERLEEIYELLAKGRLAAVSFVGEVEQMDGDQWLVSGINVLIAADSQLPSEPVTVGASVKVEGITTLQGFVDAKKVGLLKPGVILPSIDPTRTATPTLKNLRGTPSIGENSNGDDGTDAGESSGDKNENDDDNSSDSNSNDGNEDDNDNDDSSDDNSNSGSNKGSGNSGSGSGGGDPDEPDDDD